MEEKIKIELSMKQLEVIYTSLFEVAAKVSLPVIQELEKQIKSYNDSKNAPTTE